MVSACFDCRICLVVRPPAADRCEVFAVNVGNRLYYPQAFLGMDRETVAAVCRALGDLSAGEKLMFWLRNHGTLAGKSVAAAAVRW